MRSETNYKKKTCLKKKTHKHMEAKQYMLLNNLWITEEIKEETKKYLEKNENESTIIQNLEGCSKSSKKEKKFIAIQSYLRK